MSKSIQYLRIVNSSSSIFNTFLFMVAFFIMKLGQFLIVPFLAVYLNYFSLLPLSIGIIIASGQLSHSITSLLTGHLLDKYNPKQIFIITLLGTGISYECLNKNESLGCFILLNVFMGIFRAIFDNSSKTLLVSSLKEQHRNAALGVRYAVLNLAAALGPLIGVRYASGNSMQLFHLIAYSYLFTALLLLFLWSKMGAVQTTPCISKRASIIDTLQVIKDSPSLKTLFFISFICNSLYSQITSSLAQYITKEFAHGISIYSNMLILNAITCVLLQVFIGSFLRRIHYMRLAVIGLSLFAIGFLGFCFAKNSCMLNFSMLIVSLGEVIFFPLNDILLSKIASPKTIGSCYGVLNASTIGLAVGPILGGAIYQMGNHYFLFLICSLASLITISFYKKLDFWDAKKSEGNYAHLA